jgi:hypothetical protein
MNSKMTKNETKQNMERRHYLTHGMIKANNKSANTERASEDTTSSHREHSRSNKLFFTTTDLLDKINSVLSSSAVAGSNIDPSKLLHQNNDEDDRHIPAAAAAPCFELQRRLPNGSTRKATTEEVAAADFQAKLKQVREFSYYNCLIACTNTLFSSRRIDNESRRVSPTTATTIGRCHYYLLVSTVGFTAFFSRRKTSMGRETTSGRQRALRPTTIPRCHGCVPYLSSGHGRHSTR